MSAEMRSRWETEIGRGKKWRFISWHQWHQWLTIAGRGKTVTPLKAMLRWLMLKVFIMNFSISYTNVCIASVCLLLWVNWSLFFWTASSCLSFSQLSAFLSLFSSLHLLCSVLLTSVNQSIRPRPFVLWSRPVWAQVRVHMCAYRRVKTSTLRRAALVLIGSRCWLQNHTHTHARTHMHIKERCDLWTWGSIGLLEQQACTRG